MARIAVTGAGMGAMAAAARLATAGHRVTVLERTDTHGGAVRRFSRDGFAFDTGPGLLHLPAVYRDLFVKTGREPLEQCVEMTQVDTTAHHVFPGTGAREGAPTSVSLPNASRGKVIDALDAALGEGAGERWADMLTRAREAWEAARRPLLEEPLPHDEASRAVLARDSGYPAPRKKSLLRLPRSLRAGRTPTLAGVAADELRDPRLAAVLGSYAWSYGLDPADAPPGATVLAYLEDAFGTWYVRGGIRALADAVHDRCVARGVEFRFGTEVTAVRERDGRATGLELADGGTVGADLVVLGAGPLDGAQDAGPAAGHARLTVLLALRGRRPAGTPHRTVVHDATGPGRSGPPLTVLRPDDPALRPDEAHETAVLTLPVPAGSVRDRGAGEQLAERLLAATDAAGLGLRERLLWHEVRTPADYEAETGAPGGRVPVPALAGGGGAFLRPPNRTAVEGVYAAGGRAHPGGGLAHGGMSGALVAGLVVEGADWRGSY